MYVCHDCGNEFKEPEQKRTTYEAMYGVSGQFPDSTVCYIGLCPFCGSESYEEVRDEEDWEDDYPEYFEVSK